MDSKTIEEKIDAIALSEVPNTKLVQALKQVQLERIRTEIELQKKIFELELEYAPRLAEFDEKRRKIVTGEVVPTDAEAKYEYAVPDEPIVESTETGIPQFWPTIFRNLDLTNDMVHDCDQKLFEHLVDVRLVLLKEPRGYRLEFEFSENEYFTNKVLTKEYYFAEGYDQTEPLNYDSMWVERCVGCKIDWRSPDKNVTEKQKTKKMKNHKTNEVKSVTKTEKCDSFFNFFDPPTVKIDEADEDTKELLAADFDIGETIRINVIPRAVIYYTGEGIDEEDDYDEMDEDMLDFDEYDEEDDDEEEDEEESDDENSPASPKGGKKGTPNGRGKK